MNWLPFIIIFALIIYIFYYFERKTTRLTEKVEDSEPSILYFYPEFTENVPRFAQLLAGIHKNHGDIKYIEFSAEEKKKLEDVYTTLRNKLSVSLTFLYEHNLVFIKSEEPNCFRKLNIEHGHILSIDLGDIGSNSKLTFSLKRRHLPDSVGSYFYTGYLAVESKSFADLTQKKQVIKLFDFPEILIRRWNQYDGNKQHDVSINEIAEKALLKAKLTKDVFTTDVYKDDLGDFVMFSETTFEQDMNSVLRFKFHV